ncbi:hypothetical protein KBD61_03695 [Patescibacteria group bacterium]|nr:hypothetical protein [Patescibacteria group bacterium]MBP9710100.1 hypothetical protein [Patescibacteria group bacterium]
MIFSFFRGRWAVRLLVFIALLLVLFVLRRGFFRSSPQGSAPTPPVRTSVELQQVWRSEVQTILRQYDQDRNAAKAREALLGLTVTREDQAKHLALVLAFNASSERQPNADELLAQARNGFERN